MYSGGLARMLEVSYVTEMGQGWFLVRLTEPRGDEGVLGFRCARETG
jgi:hypothetical protein